MLNLEPIKARLAAATPGIWYFDVDGLPPSERGGVRVLDNWLFWEDEATAEDTDLIANAPADLAALVKEVENQREIINGLRKWAVDIAVASQKELEKMITEVFHLRAKIVQMEAAAKEVGRLPDAKS